MTGHEVLIAQIMRAMEVEQPYAPNELAGMLMIRGANYAEAGDILSELSLEPGIYMQGGYFHRAKSLLGGA